MTMRKGKTFGLRAGFLVLWCALTLALAALARYGLVEAGPVAAFCDAGGSGWRCTIRSVVIQAFILDRLGWAALVLATIAWGVGNSWLAAISLFLACAGLVLYSTQLCAPAALLAALVFARDRHPPIGSSTAADRATSTPL
jgi:hypothetical protein